MTTYTCDPAVELTGQSALALIQSIRHESFASVLEKHGLTEIEPDAWYSLQSLLDAMSELSEQGSAMFDFVSIGLAAAENSVLPPGTENLSLEQFLGLYAQIYPTRHRNGDPGTLSAEKVGPNHLKLTLRIPYPDDIFYGVIYGYVRRFTPPGVSFTVKYDETLPRREQGGESTVIHVMWE